MGAKREQLQLPTNLIMSLYETFKREWKKSGNQ